MKFFKKPGLNIIILLCYFFIFPLLFLSLSKHSVFIAYFTYLMLGVNTGIFITDYLNSFLKIKKLSSYLIFSFFFGITLFTLLILTIGNLGLRIDGIYLLINYYLLSSLSLLSLYKKTQSYQSGIIGNLIYRFKNINLDLIDLILCGGLLVFAIYSIFIILNYYFLEYDNFSFWITDSVIIYQTKFLRANAEIINSVNYTSYYPLHAVYLYEIMGGVKEQYAAFIALLYSSLISILIYSNTSIKNYGTKILIAAALFLVNCSFAYNQNLIFTFYADVPAAALFAFITIIILKPIDTQENLYKKILAIILLVYAFVQIKYFFFYYAVFLIASFVYIDWKNIKMLWRNNPHTKVLKLFIPLIAALVITETAKYYYFHVVWPYYQLKSVGYLVEPLSAFGNYSSLKFFGEYVSTTLNILLNKFNWLYLLALTALVYPFTIKDFKYDKYKITLLILNILVPLSIIILYTKNQRDLTNMSIVRYISLGLFLIPMLIQIYPIKIYALAKNRLLSALVATAVVIPTLFFLFTRNSIDITFHTGRYADSSELYGYADMADYIRNTIGENEKVVVVNNYSGYTYDKDPNGPKEYMTNIDFDSRFLKYFLFDSNHIGAYMLKMDQFNEALKENEVKNLAVIFNENQDPRYYEYFGIKDPSSIEGLTLYLFKVKIEGDKVVFEDYELES